MTRAALIYPHQLFADHPALLGVSQAVLVEEPLLFTQYRFHRQKLILHRASMRRFAEDLRERKLKVHYVEAEEVADTAAIGPALTRRNIRSVQYVDPCDDWLSARLETALQREGIGAKVVDDPHFLTPCTVIRDFRAEKKRLYFTEFYIAQRRRLGLLLENGKPAGGKWSFDSANRKKLPKAIRIPVLRRPREKEPVRDGRQ
jgi:deoxyribodipyrimidine photolyase-related protein